MREIRSDNVFHPPSGSEVPGKVDANPYMNFPPMELRKLLTVEKDSAKLDKIKSALKQWERVYVYPGYPWRITSGVIKRIARVLLKCAEQNPPAVNVPYYQDTENPSYPYEGVMEILQNTYDQDNARREDITRQGERPEMMADFLNGNFLGPHDPVFPCGNIDPVSDGPSPEGLEVPLPPTGGDIDRL